MDLESAHAYNFSIVDGANRLVTPMNPVCRQLEGLTVKAETSELALARVLGYGGNKRERMKKQNFNEMVNLIVKEDDRYTKEAYVFLKEALDFTMSEGKKRKGKLVSKNQRHVTGQELLEGVREYALEQYGPMAYIVLTSWGLKVCEDFGEIVFNLIEYGVFSKNDEDSKEDFATIYDFEEAFLKPFLPEKRRLKRPRYKVIKSL